MGPVRKSVSEIASQIAYNIQLLTSGIVCLSAHQMVGISALLYVWKQEPMAHENRHQYAQNRPLQAEQSQIAVA
jgi:hypothetical protein